MGEAFVDLLSSSLFRCLTVAELEDALERRMNQA
jgi:hypothetical protein